MPDGAGRGAMLEEAIRELEAAIHDARVAFDCIGLGEIDRAHTSAVTARIAIDAAMTAMQTALAQTPGQARAAGRQRLTPLRPGDHGREGDTHIL